MYQSVITILAICSVAQGTEQISHHGPGSDPEPIVNNGPPVVSYQATTYDPVKLARRPNSQPHFDVDKWIGKWYKQAQLVPCTWSGSSAFEDWSQVITKDSKGLISNEKYAYEGDCPTTNARLYQSEPNKGCFRIKDSFGDFTSGGGVIVATDYKSFSVSWTCLKTSGDGQSCDDVVVVVKSRKPNPSPHTWKVVEAILQKLWNMSLTELKRIKHTGAC